MSPRAVLSGGAKLGAAVLLTWLVLRRIDLGRSLAIASALPRGLMLLVLALLALQALLSAWRWSLVAARGPSRLGLGVAFRLFMISLFYNQTLPSTVPGDAARVLGAGRFGGLQAAAVGVFLDRLLTLMALLVLTLFAACLFAGRAAGDFLLLLPSLTLAAALGGLAVAVLARRRLAQLLPGRAGALAAKIGDSVVQLFQSRDLLGLSALSFAIHGFSIATFYVLAQGMALGLSPLGAFITVPMVLLAALLPISVNGWGIREATMILVLASFGIGRTESATLSILFGIFQLALGLLGGIFLLFPSAPADAKAAPQNLPASGP